eukprot:4618849-Alexandrium_andersonii.AAC.1
MFRCSASCVHSQGRSVLLFVGCARPFLRKTRIHVLFICISSEHATLSLEPWRVLRATRKRFFREEDALKY